ncbi:MAG: diadenylate cyclase CdaA [bacterium]
MESFSLIWTNYLRHIFDVALATFIFYWLLRLFKGTRAIQVVLGVILLAVFTLLTMFLFKFKATGWLLNNFWSAGVVLFVIIFQPELRAAFAHLGSKTWGKIILPEELDFLKELIQSVKGCVEHNIGAIIVLEQDIGLRNYIETGTLINGQLSKELVVSIFCNKSPLHDGAVIVQKTRLIAAGCLLPLSNNPGISKILGTRHRAALGLTEITDSLVITVSEETGKVSLSKEGKIEWGINIEKLQQILVEYYKSKMKRSR